jgi:hypothetical protein
MARYFYQPPLELEFVDDAAIFTSDRLPQALKLIVNWSLDALLRLGRFELACPSQFDSEEHQVATHWSVPIPRSNESMAAALASAAEKPGNFSTTLN